MEISEKKISFYALLFSIFALLGGCGTQLEADFRGCKNCTYEARASLIALQDSLGQAIVQVYLCSDRPKEKCVSTRTVLRHLSREIQKLDLNDNDLDQLLKAVEQARLEIDKSPFSTLNVDAKADTLMDKGKKVFEHLEPMVTAACRTRFIWVAAKWIAAAIMLIVALSCLYNSTVNPTKAS